jgi:hypothetical protein
LCYDHFRNLSAQFPLQTYISPVIDIEKFKQSHAQQPLLFIRIRPGKRQIVEQALQNASIVYEIIKEDTFSFANTTSLQNVIQVFIKPDEEKEIKEWVSKLKSNNSNVNTNLFNDTNYVYFTWNNSLTNMRMSLQTDVNFTGYTPTNYIYNEKIYSGTGNYSYGKKTIISPAYIYDPRYIECEGYGTIIAQGNSIQTAFGNLNIFPSSSLPATIKVHASGDSENYPTVTYDHQLKLEYFDNTSSLSTLTDTTFYSYQQVYIEKQIPSNLLQNNSLVKVSSINNPFFSGFTNSTRKISF